MANRRTSTTAKPAKRGISATTRPKAGSSVPSRKGKVETRKKKRQSRGKKPLTEEERLEKVKEIQAQMLEKLSGEEGFTIIEGQERSLETLMDVPNRKPLDPGESVLSDNSLVRFVLDRPFQYKRFLQMLRSGAHPLSAALATDFAHKSKLYKWLRDGCRDVEVGLDTYQSRLYRDITRSLGVRMSEVEANVSIDDPIKWLRNGPGRLVHDAWRDDPVNQSHKKVEVNQTVSRQDRIPDGEVLSAQVLLTAPEESEERQGPPVEDNDYAKALAILRESGVMDQPEGWEAALKLQAGEEMTDEEIDAMSEDEQSLTCEMSNQLLLTEQERQAQSS